VRLARDPLARDTNRMRSLLPLALCALLSVSVARADEFHLKDGSKINGTIVGFEEDSFKVKTSYGFAVIRKDQVVSVLVGDPSKDSAPETKHPVGAKSKKDKNSEINTPDLKDTAPQATKAAEPAALQTSATSAERSTALASATSPAKGLARTPDRNAAAGSAPPASSVAAVPPKAPPEPPKRAAPEPIREQIVGNEYTNQTYGFHMYKPPDWEVIEGARTMLPGAIAAMGTADETTYLLIGEDPAQGSMAASLSATNERLSAVMDNYRVLGDRQITVSGIPAMERRFRGFVDNHDWSGVVVLLTRDGKLYTIFGMTYADSDLVQIQENVISRAIRSLSFTNN
jgi:hypothetical protein